MEKSRCSVLCLCENCLSSYDLLSDLDQTRGRGMGACGAGRVRTEYKEKEGLGGKYERYQHSPQEKNSAMMKAKSREEGKDWQAQGDREWRLKWQRQVGGCTERKRVKSGQLQWNRSLKTDKTGGKPERHLLLWNRWGFTLGTTSLQEGLGRLKETSGMNRNSPRMKQTKQPENTVVFLGGEGERAACFPLLVGNIF